MATDRVETDEDAEADPWSAVEVLDLVKTFPARGGGTLVAVDHVSFSVYEGEVFGFLGPNGAGKTTTLEIIEGLQQPTSGHVTVLGMDAQRDRDRVKERIGVQLQAGAYFNHLTLEEILDLFGSFYPRRLAPRVLLEKVGLLAKRRALVRELSGGQAQRFSIVAAMVNDPDVVFLDEPTTGLDPQARRNLWDLVRLINKDEGKTVVLTTHYMEEAEVLCDRVAVIDHGTIQALDTTIGLIHRLPTAYRIVFSTRQEASTDELAGLPGVHGVSVSENGDRRYELGVSRSGEAILALIDWVRAKGIEVEDLSLHPPPIRLNS